ncbi:MAG: T9SS type A sorting domain-containing protein [Flavobacteriales bacterium]|nr:T9SS type A sorting domain-containing protein [Flavobacteriales bacterium]
MQLRKALMSSLILCAPASNAQLSGDLDLSFSGDGIATVDFATNQDDRGQCMLVQPDGRILLAGGSHQGNGVKFALARLMPDGSLDASFGTNGRATSQVGSPPSLDDSFYALALQPDGKIVAVGRTFSNGVGYRAAVLRYNSNGTLDASFSGDGIQVDDLGAGNDDSYYGVAVQPDGRIVAAGIAKGTVDYDVVVARYTTSGALDASFSSDGYAIMDIGNVDNRASAMVLQPDGSIVIAGEHGPPSVDCDFLLARFTPTGGLDPNFGTNGVVISAFSTSTDWAYALALQPDGRLVASGLVANGAQVNLALARYEADGDLDPTFDGDGLALNTYSAVGYARSVAVLPDGRIAAGGNASSLFMAVMYNANGTPDTGFSADGVVTPITGSSAFAYAVAVQSDGKLLLAGQANYGATANNFVVARYYTAPVLIGLDELNEQAGALSVLPNPATDMVHVRGRANDLMRVTDMTGRTMLLRTMRADQLSIDVSGWARGSYLITLEREGTILREKVVVE